MRTRLIAMLCLLAGFALGDGPDRYLRVWVGTNSTAATQAKIPAFLELITGAKSGLVVKELLVCRHPVSTNLWGWTVCLDYTKPHTHAKPLTISTNQIVQWAMAELPVAERSKLAAWRGDSKAVAKEISP